MSQKTHIDKKPKVITATLGPEGTFSQQAVQIMCPESEIVMTRTIRDVLVAVEAGEVDNGVVPVENSIDGAVSLTLDALNDHDLKVEAEEVVPIRHCLMALGGLTIDRIKTLHVHEQAYAQCEDYITANMSDVALKDATSNAKAAKLAAGDKTGAAIGPSISARIYGLNILKRRYSRR